MDEAAYQTTSGAVMTDKTFPKPFLSDNSDGGLRIRNVIMEDDKLTFEIEDIPTGFENLFDDRKMQLKWWIIHCMCHQMKTLSLLS